MVKCGGLFEVRTEFVNNIYTSFVFKGAKQSVVNWTVSSAVVRKPSEKQAETMIGA
jgi:hypothetical protein